MFLASASTSAAQHTRRSVRSKLLSSVKHCVKMLVRLRESLETIPCSDLVMFLNEITNVT